MKTTLHFSNMRSPTETRRNIEHWIKNYFTDLDADESLKLEIFCKKQSEKALDWDAKFSCIILARSRWTQKSISITTEGHQCWDTISVGCQILKENLKKHKHIWIHQRSETPKDRRAYDDEEKFSYS